MGVLKFDGVNDNVIFASLATVLATTLPGGAFTMAFLFKRNDNTTSDALGYLTLSSNTSQVGVSLWTNPGIACDGSGGALWTTVEYRDNLNDTIIAVMTRAAASSVLRFHGGNLTDASAWTHNNNNTNSFTGAATPCAKLEIGSWNTTGDWWPGWIGLVGLWTGQMSDANVEALSANKRTSDWYQSAHGTPAALIELNTASPVDLLGNATSPTVNGATLDTGETLGGWNFDGKGSAPAIDVDWNEYPKKKPRRVNA